MNQEKTTSINSLQDLHKLLLETQEPVSPSYKDHYNHKYDLVARMMYLTGVEKQHFALHVPDLTDDYNSYEKQNAAKIVRSLCILRTSIIRNFLKIVNAFRYDLKNLGSLPEYIPSDSVQYLSNQGIYLQKDRPDATNYLIAINKEMASRINNVRKLFPDWVNWEYIRPLFLMPNGQKPEGVKAAGDYYNSDRNRYPFQCWMNWTVDGCGNIFYSDEKFVKVLYEANKDAFVNRSLVVDAGDILMGNLHDFLETHEKTLIVVDCENSDPIKLAAALISLSLEQKRKIHKVMLFDSDYTTPAWETLSGTGVTAEFGTEHVVVPRLYEHKSQVDMTLAVQTSKEIFVNGVDAVILVSSDSDYWALIRSLPTVDFLVMLEKMKSGQTIRDALNAEGYTHCFIDDFCTANTYSIKTKTIRNTIQKQIDARVDFNIRKMLDEVMKATWLEMTEKEKENFYSLYLKTMRLSIDKEGEVRIVLG